MRRLQKRVLFPGFCLLLILVIGSAIYNTPEHQSDFFEKAMAGGKAYPCIGEIYDRMHPNASPPVILAREYVFSQSQGPRQRMGSRHFRVFAASMMIRIRFSKTDINRMLAALPISKFRNSDETSRFFFARNYCALNQDEQDIVAVYLRRTDVKSLKPQIQRLNNPQAIAALAEMERPQEAYRKKCGANPDACT
jgi:hypothetical protein